MLFKIARSSLGGWMVGWMMEHLSNLLPVDRLFETPRLVAFRHPRPAYSIHILIVPKKAVHNLMDLESVGDDFASLFMADLLACVRKIVADFDLEQSGYRLIVNGGGYQDVPELHFHLVSGSALG